MAAIGLVALAGPACLGAAQPNGDPPPGEYRIVDGRVDRGTYAGWRLFHSACHGCHGVGAVGTDKAPDLVTRVPAMGPRAFAAWVLANYRIVAPNGAREGEDGAATRDGTLEGIMRRDRSTGGAVVMPAWEGDGRVRPHVLDLYAYLSARGDGKLGPGEPGRLNRRIR